MDWINYFQFFFIAFFLVILFFLLGQFILCFFKPKDNFITNSLSIVIGLFSTVFIYAIVRTCFNSIFSIGIIVLLICFLFAKAKSKHKFKFIFPSTKFIGVLAILLLVVSLLQFFRYDVFNHNLSPIGELDDPIYITIAEQMNLQGIESYLILNNTFSSDIYSQHAPYHYFDLWFIALLQNIGELKPIDSYLFIYTPIFSLLSILFLSIFIYSVLKTIGIETRVSLIYFVASIFCFIIGYFPFFEIGNNGFEFMYSQVLIYPKLFYAYLFLGLGTYFYCNKYYFFLVVLSLILGMCFPLYWPIIFVFLFAILLIMILKKKSKEVYLPMLLFFLTLFLVIGFYYLNGAFSTSDILINSEQSKRLPFLTIIYNAAKDYIPKLIYFSPFCILASIFIYKNYNNRRLFFVLTVPILFLVSGFISYCILYSNVESRQLMHQTFSSSLYFMFAYFTFAFFVKRTSHIALRIFIGTLLIIQVIVSVNKNILNNSNALFVSKEFKNEILENKLLFTDNGAFVGDANYIDKNDMHILPYINYYTGFVKFLPNKSLIQITQINLSNHSNVRDEFRRAFLLSPFLKYTDKYDYPEAVSKFINDNKIGFVVWENSSEFNKTKLKPYKTIHDPHSKFNISFINPIP